MQAYLNFRASVAVDLPRDVRQEATRRANLIIDRVKKGGEQRLPTYPIRSAPLFTDLYALLTRIWQQKQGGLCALCGAPLFPGYDRPPLGGPRWMLVHGRPRRYGKQGWQIWSGLGSQPCVAVG